MNWTGGRLYRSRNAKSSISAKQKNHFAKARAKLQNAQSSTPQSQSFDLGHWRPDYETTHLSPSARSQQHGNLQHQTILDDFENVRPLVKKLQTLNQFNESHKRKRPSLEHCIHDYKPGDSGGKAMSPIIISSRPSSVSSAQSSAPAIAVNEDPPNFDSLGTSGLTSIEAKRRRLLQMEDWVGVERRHSKPAHMTFTEAEDRDMIGKRRQMKKSHHVTPDATDRTSKRKGYLEQPRQLDFPTQDLSVGQMSIRIGSAVDRSQASVSSEEMLFDSEVQKRNQRTLPAAPVIQPGELGSLPLSDQTHREIRASSAFMDDLSSVAAVFQPEEMRPLPLSAHRYGAIDTPSGSVDDSSSFGFVCQPSPEDSPKHKGLRLPIDDKDNETHGEREPSTPLELKRAQEEQSFRLVFEKTPQPPDSNWTDSDPIIRDFAYPNVGPRLAPLKISPLPRAQDISTPDSDAEADDSSIGNPTSRPRSFGNAINQIPGNHVPTGRTQHTKRSDNLGGEEDPTTNSEFSQISKKEIHSPVRRKSLEKDKLQPNREEESIWRSFTMMDEMEDTRSFKAQPTSNNRGKEPTANQNLNHNAQSSTSKINPRSPIEDEEQIWRAFIFSDDDNSPINEWTLEPSSPLIQSPAPSNPTRTQPSMVAEACTSPIKQNPHLHEASPPVPPSETVGQLKQGFSKRLDSATSHSSEVLAEVSSPTEEGSLGFPADGTAQSETADPLGEVNTTAQRTRDFTFTPWTVPSLAESNENQTKPHPHSSLSAQPPTTNSSSPNPTILSSDERCKSVPQPSSSLIPAPPSTTYNNNTLSSDELHGPSPSPVTITLRSEPKVVFTPPKRYIGPRAIEPKKPVALGRVPRNGKRVGGQVGGKAKEIGKGKGKGRGVVDGEGCGDEIVDD